MIAVGYSQIVIAQELNRDPSTISREINVRYLTHRAQMRSDLHKHESHQKMRLKIH